MINNVAHNRFLLRLRFMLHHIQVHIKEGLCCVVTIVKKIARAQKADLGKGRSPEKNAA